MLKVFEAQHHIRVQLRILENWVTAWPEIISMVRQRDGSDLSEIGTTWIGNLISMEALRPFKATEITSFGGASAFLPSAWQSGSLDSRKEAWSIPWLVDTSLLYYRRDLLEQAGVNESTAFQTPQQLEQTLNQLQASGIAIPWVVPTCQTLSTLHYLASWVWGSGGDFIMPDGRRTLFNQPKARAGIRAYFDLYRYLTPPARHLNYDEAHRLFWEGQAAVTLDNPWRWLSRAREPYLAPEIFDQVRIALPPGIPYVGGTNFVLWRHARYPYQALELIRYLTSYQPQIDYFQRTGLLPANRAALASLPVRDEAAYKKVVWQGLKIGRSFRLTPSWGLIEDKLSLALTHMWDDLLSLPNPDLEAIMNKHLKPLAQQLDVTLASRAQR